MTPMVCLIAGALFFAGSYLPAGSAAAGTPLALLLAAGPIAGIVVQVRQLRLGQSAGVWGSCLSVCLFSSCSAPGLVRVTAIEVLVGLATQAEGNVRLAFDYLQVTSCRQGSVSCNSHVFAA